jgi:enoyl-CoA hydratase/carnithine racemase
VSTVQAPEGCSSYMFPLIMGKELSDKVLYESKSITASEALQSGFVHYVYPPNEVRGRAEEYCMELTKSPLGSEKLNRLIVQKGLVDILKTVNEKECDECEKKWVCQESFAAIATYLQSRKMYTAAFILR